MKNTKPNLSRASVVRLIACQALCMFDDKIVECKDLNEILKIINTHYIEEYFKKTSSSQNDYKTLYKTEFLKNMLNNIVKQIQNIDEILEKEIRNFNNTISNILDTTKQCFRLAVYEFQNIPEVPTEIIINEYVDIVAEFTNDDNEAKFANRVLENLAIKLRNKEDKADKKTDNKIKKERKIISLHKTE